LGEEISATPEEVNEVVRRAKIAQQEWGNASIAERKAVLYDLLQYVVENQEMICQLSITDTGKTCKFIFFCALFQKLNTNYLTSYILIWYF
jgi:acyl-CoA reductase-like NAD-dependent aldehyde dehydrogenase